MCRKIAPMTITIIYGICDGLSRYVPKWKKQACEIPASQHPNSHYICDEAGEVKCLPGKEREIDGKFSAENMGSIKRVTVQKWPSSIVHVFPFV